MENNLEQLKKLAKVFNTDNVITTTEIQEVLRGIMQIMNSFKKGNEELNSETKKIVNSLLSRIMFENEKLHSSVSQETSAHKAEIIAKLDSSIKKMSNMCEDLMLAKPLDGINPDPEDVVPLVLEQLPPTILDTPEQLRDKLETLKGDERLDIKFVKGLEDLFKKGKGKSTQMIAGGARFINQLFDVKLTSLANNDVLKWDSTLNMWVNGTGGGGGSPGGSDTQVQFNDAGAFGGNAGLTFNKTTGLLTAATSTTSLLMGGVASPHSLTGITSTVTPVTSPISGTPSPLSYVSASFTDASAPTLQVGQYTAMTVDPNASWSGKLARAGMWEVYTPSTNANTQGTLQGGLFQVRHDSTGAAGGVTGLSVSALSASGSGAITTLIGIQGSSRFSSTGANGTMFGNTNAMSFNVAGTATSIIGYQTTLTMTNGATVSGDVLLFNTNNITNTASTITGKTVGYYVGDITAGTQTGGAYSFYNSDANAPQYFAGVTQFANNAIFNTDNTYDIGASGATRPRTGYLGTSLQVGSPSTTQNARIQIGGAYSLTNPSANNGYAIRVEDATYTNTTSSGTIALLPTVSMNGGTYAASSATTITNAAILYLTGAPAQGTNVTITNRWGLYFDSSFASYIKGGVISGTAPSSIPTFGFSAYGSQAGALLCANFQNDQTAAADVGVEVDWSGSNVRQGAIITGWDGAATTDAYMAFGTRTSGAFSQKWRIQSGGSWVASTDNSWDIGNSGALRPRTGYFGTSLVAPTINATTALQLNGTSINTAGTLSNVAYLNQANTFSANSQTFSGAVNSNATFDFKNTDTGASANTLLRIFNGTNDSLVMRSYSATHATNPNEAEFDANRAGGLIFKASDASGAVSFATGGTTKRWTITSAGHLIGVADNTYDIGASGATRPRTGYFGTSVVSPVVNATTGIQINGAAASNKILKGNGTNFVASTETYAAPGTSGNVMTSDGTNWTSAAPAAATVTPTMKTGIDWRNNQANGTYTLTNAGSGGQSSDGNQMYTVTTGNTATSYSKAKITLSSGSTYTFLPGSIYSGRVVVSEDGTSKAIEGYWGLGDITVSGSAITWTGNHIGFKFKKGATANISLYATVANGTTETESSAIDTFSVASNTYYDFIIQVVSTSSVNFYSRKMNAASYTVTNITTNIPTADNSTVMIAVSNISDTNRLTLGTTPTTFER
jgi:hypothetical protein